MKRGGILAAVALFTALGLFTARAYGRENLKHGPSAEERKQIEAHNQKVFALGLKTPKARQERPFSELENAGYLFFSSETIFDSGEAKRIMAKNLPKGVILVIYAEPGDNLQAIRAQYSRFIDEDRLKVITLPEASRGFWARDGLPVPVWTDAHQLSVIDARYYHRFEPDQQVAEKFSAPLYKHNYYYEGGNFMVNESGDCVMVDNSQANKIPLSIFENIYGCRRTIRLPFEKGIGHVDESVRFVRSNTVITDSENYAKLLRSAGLEVLKLPRPEGEYETYVNSLLINGTIFVPVFNQPTDREALRVYEQAGLKVVPIETIALSNDGNGSIHCITMTYPPVPFDQLLNQLGAKEL